MLVVEDDRVLNKLIVDHLSSVHYTAHGVSNWKDAQRFLKKQEPNLILMDVRLPDANGLELLPELCPQHPVIVLTAHSTIRDAVQAMKAGAAEYLIKPISLDELDLMISRALEADKLRRDYMFCKERLQVKDELIGSSEAIEKTREIVKIVAPSDMTVLIQGESGVGKELVANAIHLGSNRATQNFVAVDCCTLQEQLFESELFGHEKGAFTSAHQLKKGLIEGAEGGTLFLDEIGEIEPSVQAKLLRLLDTGQFRRVGGTKDITANVRIVVATNRDLAQMVKDGGFRDDLYYRLSAFVIQVPPLRERREDVPLIVQYFIESSNLSRKLGKHTSIEATKLLVSYDWPGNVRELRNVIERALLLSGNSKTIGPEHLAISVRQNSRRSGIAIDLESEPPLKKIEEEYLRLLVAKYQGHRATIAKILGVSERNLYRMIAKHGL